MSKVQKRIPENLRWSKILRALADESRLLIIRQLLKGEASVVELSKILGIKVYNISRHLRILENNGLVQKRKEGVHRIYHISSNLRHYLSHNNQVLDLGCCKFIFKDD